MFSQILLNQLLLTKLFFAFPHSNSLLGPKWVRKT